MVDSLPLKFILRKGDGIVQTTNAFISYLCGSENYSGKA
jgi:hypothetical protein